MPLDGNTASDLPLPHGTGWWTHHGEQPPEPDPERVQQLVGKTLLIGVDYHSHDGQLFEQKQFFGPITEITRQRGIVIRDEITASEYCLPLDLDNLHPAKKGEYRLRASGCVVTDPDYTTVWNRRAHAPKET
jgi:hypothetical protein